MKSGWLLRFASCTHTPARARLFCFPHAAGGAAVYRLWPNGLPRELDMCAVQLPGRANRLGEPAIHSIPELIEGLLPALLPLLDVPFAFFGHSMGAVMASELVREMHARGAPMPEHLIVSGRRPPSMANPDALLHGLSDKDFIIEINRRYGGISAELLQHDDLMALLLPALRADITALETYQPAERDPLDVPITVFGGSQDRLTPRDHLEGWRRETRGSFRIRVFPGDHFYLEPRRVEVLADLSATLSGLVNDRLTRRQVL